MTLLILVHRWVGLALASVLLIVGATGVALLAKGPYYRAVYPDLARPLAQGDVADYGRVVAAIHATFPDVRTIKLPQPGMNAFQVWLGDEREAFVHPRTGAVIDEWHWSERLPAFVFELHAHLLGGAVGLWVNGLVAVLTILLLGLGGVLIWWPRRRSVSLTRLGWSRWTPGALVQAHTATGVVVLMPVIVFAGTGLAIAWAPRVMPALSAWLDGTHAVRATPQAVMKAATGPLDWQRVIDEAQAAVPDGRLVFLAGGPASESPVTFRARLPGEWHPNGRSLVLVDPTAPRVLEVVDARTQGRGTRLGYAMYPVHAARIGGRTSWPLVMAAIVAGAGLCWLGVTGTAAWWTRRRAAHARVTRRALA